MTLSPRDRYYVYIHVDPMTSSVVYVGKGTRGRAWVFSRDRSGGRKDDHFLWMLGLEAAGLTPANWVYIVDEGLSEKEALSVESTLIGLHDPVFNKNTRRSLSYTAEQFREMVALRSAGVGYKEIADTVGTSTMTAHRALNGKTKSARRLEDS